MKVSIDLPEIEGFEYSGEYRAPKLHEWIAIGSGDPMKNNNPDNNESYFILKKKKPVYTILNVQEDKWVPINALEDALRLLELDVNAWTQENIGEEEYLKELLK